MTKDAIDFKYFIAGKYWNSTKRSDCPILDDSEGITLRSLGGVFICTLFGLLIAMIVLVIEVLNMKKAEKNKVQQITSAWKGTHFNFHIKNMVLISKRCLDL